MTSVVIAASGSGVVAKRAKRAKRAKVNKTNKTNKVAMLTKGNIQSK